ncbi:GerAB/ArcD/ProY family transporter [Lederbergia galactosidilytica]|uniref:Spore gernimation protein n=1 Tax=Lederbergia galactosidilytica TaxID=217031 RepID=A0A177ZM95_9BACI|nr:endospore germination permease [Lederbergia galactosidilytica]OAK69096.1 spore gernimation protein [Lederbergia galactosidilytica]
MKPTRNITVGQTTAILVSTIIGVGVLRLPLVSVQAADTGAPLLALLSTIIVFLGMWGIVKLGSHYPNETFVEYSELVIGKWPGRLYTFTVIAFFTLLTGFAAREFGAVVVTSVLPKTPLEVTVIVMLLMAVIFTRGDINTFTYIHSFYLPVILVPLLIITLVSLKDANILYLQPILGNGFKMMTGLPEIAALFQGAFILAILIPFMQKPKKALKASLWGVVISGGFFIMIIVASISLFGVEEIKTIMWPTLGLARATSLPGNTLQRLDVVFLAIWVTAVFTTIFSNYMLTVQTLKQSLRLQDHKALTLFLLPIIFLVAMFPGETIEMYRYIKVVGIFGLFLTFIFPFFILIVAKIRKVPRKKGKGAGK